MVFQTFGCKTCKGILYQDVLIAHDLLDRVFLNKLYHIVYRETGYVALGSFCLNIVYHNAMVTRKHISTVSDFKQFISIALLQFIICMYLIEKNKLKSLKVAKSKADGGVVYSSLDGGVFLCVLLCIII